MGTKEDWLKDSTGLEMLESEFYNKTEDFYNCIGGRIMINIKRVWEQDMDLLILEEFFSDKTFARIFLDEIHLDDNYQVINVDHSMTDFHGEADMVLLLQYPDKKVCIFIEDKIDADPQPGQCKRYQDRADVGSSNHEYDSYYIFLAAPEDYHHAHEENPDAQYCHRVTYEKMLEHFEKQDTNRAKFKAEIVKSAIAHKKAGYVVQENEAVTAFWKELRQFCLQEFPRLTMLGTDGPKGSRARWPEFRTSISRVKVVYKSEKGCIDLQFPEDKIEDLNAILGKELMVKKQKAITGKSTSIRIENKAWVVDFTKEFSGYKQQIREVLQGVETLCGLARCLH